MFLATIFFYFCPGTKAPLQSKSILFNFIETLTQLLINMKTPKKKPSITSSAEALDNSPVKATSDTKAQKRFIDEDEDDDFDGGIDDLSGLDDFASFDDDDDF